MTQLLSVACLSLAAKVEETEAPFSIDLQVKQDIKTVCVDGNLGLQLFIADQ